MARPPRGELDNLGAVAADGTAVPDEDRRVTFELYYAAHGDIAKRFSAGAHEYRQDLHGLAPGTVVYDVLARALPTDPASSREKLGEITLTSTPIATKAGDERLFFQHSRGRAR